MALGRRLTELRKMKKLTQAEIAKKLHLTRSTYAQYEVDRRIPEYATLEKLADFFEVSIDYIVGRTDEKKAVLSDTSRKLIDMLDLSDEEIMNKMDFIVDGIKLDQEDIRVFLSIVRAERLRKGLTPNAEQKTT